MEKLAFTKVSLFGVRVSACGGVAMLGGDKMGSNTQVPASRCTWAPVAMSCHARH
jgi:hypothetical protein